MSLELSFLRNQYEGIKKIKTMFRSFIEGFKDETYLVLLYALNLIRQIHFAVVAVTMENNPGG